MKNIKTLDDIGFIGNLRCRRTEKNTILMGNYFRQLRAFRRELLREPTEHEHRAIIRNIQNAYRKEHYVSRKTERREMVVA